MRLRSVPEPLWSGYITQPLCASLLFLICKVGVTVLTSQLLERLNEIMLYPLGFLW